MTSQALYERARLTAPGGVHSPVRAFHSVGGTPVFMASARGARLTDVSGLTYIDFCLSFGPLVLGHCDPVVAAAAHQAIDDGWSYGTCEPYSLELAEWIRARVPWVERLRFVSSGTEAVMSALRVARAATNRPDIVKFEGCYHGHADGLLVRAGSGLAGRVAASSAGLPDDMIAHTLVAPLDDESMVDALFQAHPATIAAVIVEAVPANYGLLPQRPEWLRHLADTCRRHGTLLIFDEVITGFRDGVTGAAGAYGITPDLVCYGKVIGGGFPVGAYGGRADLMDLVAPAGAVYQAGTLSANPVGMRAGLATLRQMEDLDGWRVLEARTTAFARELDTRFAAVAPGLEVVHHASMFWIRQRHDEPVRRPDRIPVEQADWYKRFFHAALATGVYLPPSPYEVCFLSMAHDAETLAEASSVLERAAERARS
ncbi:MAG: glutamate-1-semialdehyde 2,1-aminomutase [Vicinamibacterales bacterium]